MGIKGLMERGRFITFEGGEGAGKSTQVKLLSDRLNKAGINHRLTREPGGSLGAEAIRTLLVSGDTDRWSGATEALLHYAARQDHLEKTIRPALAQGIWILCDRFSDSTLAYQGYGHGLPLEWLKNLHSLVLGDFVPDLTVILDIPVEQGLARACLRGGGEDRYERMGAAFHQRLRDGFLTVANADPHRCAVISALDTPEAVSEAIWAQVEARLLAVP